MRYQLKKRKVEGEEGEEEWSEGETGNEMGDEVEEIQRIPDGERVVYSDEEKALITKKCKHIIKKSALHKSETIATFEGDIDLAVLLKKYGSHRMLTKIKEERRKSKQH